MINEEYFEAIAKDEIFEDRVHRSNRFSCFTDFDYDSYEMNPFLQLMQVCQKGHPEISLDKDIFGGIPHIANMRLSVADILAQLYMLGSIEAVVREYEPDLSVEQVKEAIAYAQDFLETACESR